jgi:ubiquinone/menaquinone biosynthesis C-methylase UbiE
MEILKREFNKEKTKNNYKKIVWFYDFWSWLTESKAAKTVLKLADLKDYQKVLEIACGTGIVFEKIIKQNSNGQNIGIDLSPDMLKKAKRRLQKSGYTNYELKEGDALNLEFPDNSFDILINNFMIDLMPEELFDEIASEFYRVLKYNGIAVISIFSYGKRKTHKFWLWVTNKFPELLTGCRPVRFKEHLIKSGFTIVKEIELSQNTFPSEVLKVKK